MLKMFCDKCEKPLEYNFKRFGNRKFVPKYSSIILTNSNHDRKGMQEDRSIFIEDLANDVDEAARLCDKCTLVISDWINGYGKLKDEKHVEDKQVKHECYATQSNEFRLVQNEFDKIEKGITKSLSRNLSLRSDNKFLKRLEDQIDAMKHRPVPAKKYDDIEYGYKQIADASERLLEKIVEAKGGFKKYDTTEDPEREKQQKELNIITKAYHKLMKSISQTHSSLEEAELIAKVRRYIDGLEDREQRQLKSAFHTDGCLYPEIEKEYKTILNSLQKTLLDYEQAVANAESDARPVYAIYWRSHNSKSKHHVWWLSKKEKKNETDCYELKHAADKRLKLLRHKYVGRAFMIRTFTDYNVPPERLDT